MSSIKDIPEVLAAPAHDDFCSYLPWACLQFGVPAVVTINKIIEERSKTAKGRKISAPSHSPSSDDKESTRNINNPKIYITAIFNNANKLVGIRFENKNVTIPREVMKVIKLIVHKQPDLKRLEMRSGVDVYVLHEISEILKVSNLTEIRLDNSFVREANYAVLLETSNLRYLSLSKCKINDKVMEELCKKLEHPKPASKSLIAIILSTNMITDDGATFLAETLRSNRKLAYINLADNRISDEGAGYLFDTLVEFSIRTEELVAAKGRRFEYLRERNTVLLKTETLKSDDDRKFIKNKISLTSVSSRNEKLSKPSLKSLESSKASITTVSDHEKTAERIESKIEDFNDPFHFPNIFVRDGNAYSKGNNALLYLNVSYNNLTYISLEKILDVVLYQKLSDMERGLLDVNIDGNYLPVDCEEVQELDVLLRQKRSTTEISLQKSSSNRGRRSKNVKQKKGAV